MTRSGPVLLCYDGSEGAGQAIAAAGSVLAGGRALVLSAWESLDRVAVPAMGLADMVDGGVQNLNQELASVAADLASQGAETAREAGFDAEPLPVRADRRVWRAILDAAGEHDARVIVLGSRGLSGVAARLGSVAYRVVHHADRPVLLIPSHPRPKEGT